MFKRKDLSDCCCMFLHSILSKILTVDKSVLLRNTLKYELRFKNLSELLWHTDNFTSEYMDIHKLKEETRWPNASEESLHVKEKITLDELKFANIESWLKSKDSLIGDLLN